MKLFDYYVYNEVYVHISMLQLAGLGSLEKLIKEINRTLQETINDTMGVANNASGLGILFSRLACGRNQQILQRSGKSGKFDPRQAANRPSGPFAGNTDDTQHKDYIADNTASRSPLKVSN